MRGWVCETTSSQGFKGRDPVQTSSLDKAIHLERHQLKPNHRVIDSTSQLGIDIVPEVTNIVITIRGMSEVYLSRISKNRKIL